MRAGRPNIFRNPLYVTPRPTMSLTMRFLCAASNTSSVFALTISQRFQSVIADRNSWSYRTLTTWRSFRSTLCDTKRLCVLQTNAMPSEGRLHILILSRGWGRVCDLHTLAQNAAWEVLIYRSLHFTMMGAWHIFGTHAATIAYSDRELLRRPIAVHWSAAINWANESA